MIGITLVVVGAFGLINAQSADRDRMYITALSLNITSIAIILLGTGILCEELTRK